MAKESKEDKKKREEEEKKVEKAAELESQLIKLEDSTDRQLLKRREDLAGARVQGKAEADQIFAPGALGRVDETTPDNLNQLVADRQAQIANIQGDTRGETQRGEEIARLQDLYGNLTSTQKAMDPDAAMRAARDQGQIDIQRQLRANLKNMAQVSNSTGQRLNRGLQQGAYKQALQSTGDLERQLMMDKFGLQERAVNTGAQLASSSAQAMDTNLKGLQDVRNQKISQVNTERIRNEDIQAALRQDQLNRQLTNLSNVNAEIFGRKGLEEGRVNQELALISGVKSETLSSMNYVKSGQYQDESLEVQRINANKPPPQPTVVSGGKSVLCIQYWLTGDISTETLQGDFEYTMEHPEIDEDVKLAYYTWSTALSPYVLSKGLIYEILRPFAVGWANNMAAVANGNGYRNPTGAFMSWIGIPLHKLAGKALRLCGYSNAMIKEDPRFMSITSRANRIVNEAQRAVISRKMQTIFTKVA